ncbi:RNA polymerase II transcription mediator complex subunit 9-domain-containing protein [Calycina marina]|uniref:Mediator of RNA polymerase II transcription subunit 9 n=1 Tax=Calycina marina TaxID=1763456 RepID=A0A9P8CF62_9HELO|nr:RNA polymerase II transcription mediator complex subunit 9-domain-containing protein [Calycina marina]
METQASSSPTTILSSINPDSIDTIPILATILAKLQPLQPSSAPSPAPNVISTRDLPGATDELKHKLQKARMQVKELPDIERSVKNQEEEIARLEERIGRQKEMLGRLRQVGEEAMRVRERAMEI